MNNIKYMLILVLIGLATAACGAGKTGGDGAGEMDELVLMTHDSFAISEETLAQFEKANDATIVLLPAGDTGAMLNQAILSKEDPLADVIFGVDNTFMSRALSAEIFETYRSPTLNQIPDDFELDASYQLSPVDYGDVCLNYDKEWFANHGSTVPGTLKDLTSPEYEDLVIVENPATSSPGLAFMLATIAQFGTDSDYTYLDYWRDLRQNGVFVSDGWEDAYYGQFSASGQGARPLVVSYASSPAAEIYYSETQLSEPPTGSITSPGTCFRQIEFVGIIQGTEKRALAEKFVDFMLGTTFQEDIPLNMFVFPVNETAELPEIFVNWAEVPSQTAQVSPDEIEANREEWIREWTEVVLR